MDEKNKILSILKNKKILIPGIIILLLFHYGIQTKTRLPIKPKNLDAVQLHRLSKLQELLIL